MGAWGPALFSDDLASDVRADYTDLIGQDVPSAEATQRLVQEYRPDADPEDGPVFWLALASTQWRLGRLEQRVKERALQVIDSSADLRHWERDAGPIQARKREVVLQRLKQQLLTEPPPPKRVPRRYIEATEFDIGDVVSYRLRSGRLALLKVVDHHVDKGGRLPVVDVLDWIGDEPPERGTIARLGARLPTTADARVTGRFIIARWSKTDYPLERLAIVARSIRVDSRHTGGIGIDWWKRLDDRLRNGFGLD
jgi:hypothetical protein